jgi:subtilisin family serine protease
MGFPPARENFPNRSDVTISDALTGIDERTPVISKPLKAVTCALALALATVAVAWPTPAVAASYPNDPYYARQWYLKRIGAPAAWKTTKGKGITIAIVDTGINPTHADLKGKLVKGFDTIRGGASNTDPNGHGSGVGGVAAASTNNKTGIAGVAPDAKLMPIRACSRAGENTCEGDVAGGVMWAVDNGARVINLSLGANLPIVDPTWDAAMLYAAAQGVLVVAAAGNSSTPYCGTPAFNPSVICVGASDTLDGISSFSNYGVRLDVVAPGSSIWSTDRAGVEYKAWYGTSFSSPIVAGIGALLMSMGADNVLAGLIIRASAKEMGLPGYDLTYGFGRVDAAKAVEMCQELC